VIPGGSPRIQEGKDFAGFNMSEGPRYRLTLARVLLPQRSFLLLDEPFGALDEEPINCVVWAIETERERGQGVVVATQALPERFQIGRVLRVE
jgi:ABC-type transport system involved in cytochrome bd biosynthesis fused ATPase/permease subunit